MNKTFCGLAVSLFSSFALLSACAQPLLAITPTISQPSLTATPTISATTTPQVIATELLAELNGTLVIENNCIRVISSDFVDKSLLLIWPPDLTASIEADTVHVTIGLVSGQRQDVVLHNGQMVHISGGEVIQPNEQLKSTEPANCPGPYWAVGSYVKPR